MTITDPEILRDLSREELQRRIDLGIEAENEMRRRARASMEPQHRRLLAAAESRKADRS